LAYDEKTFKTIENQEKINQALKKYKIQKPYLLFVGRLETKKGIQSLLEAYSKLYTLNDKLSLVLVGGRGYGYKDLKPLIYNLKSRVYELGHLEDESDRAILYSAAEAFIFPSLYEGFGIPVLEAMACGCPVIASDIEPLKEVGGESAVFFKVDNEGDLVKNIKEVSQNQELRQEMIASGLERVKNFSWQKCAEKTLKVLENL
jgi:glycosyltransferase involved in cell wall biosynthesis